MTHFEPQEELVSYGWSATEDEALAEYLASELVEALSAEFRNQEAR